MTQEQLDRLNRASFDLGAVQVEILKANDKLPKPEQNDEHWRRLYRIRIDLANYMDWMKKYALAQPEGMERSK